MPASCPYCGATLNFGLKFCVVCGRHTSAGEMVRMGGLKSGIKQEDATKRLDDNLSTSDFERTRQPTRFRRNVRSLSAQIATLIISVALFFCAVRFTLVTYFPGKVHRILAPILGKQSAIVEETLTGSSSTDEEETEKPAVVEKPAAKPKPKVKSRKSSRKRTSAKRAKRHWHRVRHTPNKHTHQNPAPPK
jgi:hypothetical protein